MSKLQVGKEKSCSTHTILRIIVTKWFRSSTDFRRCRFPSANFGHLLDRPTPRLVSAGAKGIPVYPPC